MRSGRVSERVERGRGRGSIARGGGDVLRGTQEVERRKNAPLHPWTDRENCDCHPSRDTTEGVENVWGLNHYKLFLHRLLYKL